jgi:hypothetical protein
MPVPDLYNKPIMLSILKRSSQPDIAHSCDKPCFPDAFNNKKGKAAKKINAALCGSELTTNTIQFR